MLGGSKWGYVVLGLVAGLALGCQTAGYYHQAARGQLEVLMARKPVAKLRGDSDIPQWLKERFNLVLALREFCRRRLELPVDRHYLGYVDLQRPHAVWNVYACPRFSLEPKSWWYPFVGRLEYRGYFSRRDAERYAGKLARRGYDVYVEGVDAYSTLGWFRDPLLSSFVDYPEADFVATLIHELAHQKLFVSGDTDFNEAFATVVEREGVKAWFRERDCHSALSAFRAAIRREDEFIGLLGTYREKLEALYEEREGEDVSELAARKEAVFDNLREAYKRLKSEWGGYSGYDSWLARSLNNARLSSVATYHHLVPAFEALLEAKSGEWAAFYHHAKRWARMSHERRDALLAEWKQRGRTCARTEWR